MIWPSIGRLVPDEAQIIWSVRVCFFCMFYLQQLLRTCARFRLKSSACAFLCVFICYFCSNSSYLSDNQTCAKMAFADVNIRQKITSLRMSYWWLDFNFPGKRSEILISRKCRNSEKYDLFTSVICHRIAPLRLLFVTE